MPQIPKYLLLISFWLLGCTAWGQQVLSFEEALRLTLAKNYDIRMAQINAESATNSASKKNNGYLPSLNAAGGYNWTYYQGNNELITENRPFDANNSFNYNASLTLSYTLYDGSGRKFNYLQAQEGQALSEIQLKQVVENTILELSRLYHEVARLGESIGALEQAVAISEDRLKRAQYSYEFGQSSQLEVLNAKVDLNNDSIALVNEIQAFENTARNLNFIMGQPIEQAIAVNGQVDIRQNLVRDQVLIKASKYNLQLEALTHTLKQSEFAVGAAGATWKPSLNASAGYLYQGSNDPNGAFVIGSNRYGPQAGLSLSWNVFNGRNKVATENAKLQLKSRQVEQESLEQSIKSEALNRYASYQNALFVLKAQADNLATAQNNFKRSEESFTQGQIGSVAFRQAQLNLLNAEQALSQSKYAAKNAELQVLAIMGDLANTTAK